MSRQDIFWQTFPKVLDHDEESQDEFKCCWMLTLACLLHMVYSVRTWKYLSQMGGNLECIFCHHYFGYQVMTRSYPSFSKDTFLNQSQEFRDESSIIVEMRGKYSGWHCYSETKVATVVSMWTSIYRKWMSCWPGFFLTLRMRKNKSSPS